MVSNDSQNSVEVQGQYQEVFNTGRQGQLLLDMGYKTLGKREHPLEAKIAELEADKLGQYVVEYEGFVNAWGANETLIGGLILHRRWNTASLFSFWVEPQFRSLGLGDKLLQLAQNLTIEMGARAIVIETSTLHNYQFYLNRGFTVTSEIEGFIDNQTYFYMIKDLGEQGFEKYSGDEV